MEAAANRAKDPSPLLNNLQRSLASEKRAHAETQRQLAESEDRCGTLELKYQELASQAEQVERTRESEVQAAAAKLKGEVGRLQEECRGLKRKLSSTEADRTTLAAAEQERQRHQEDVARLGRELQTTQKNLAALEREKTSLATALAEARSQLSRQSDVVNAADADDAALSAAVELATAELLQEQEAREEEWLEKERQWMFREEDWQQRDEDWKRRDEEWQTLQMEWEERLAELQVGVHYSEACSCRGCAISCRPPFCANVTP